MTPPPVAAPAVGWRNVIKGMDCIIHGEATSSRSHGPAFGGPDTGGGVILLSTPLAFGKPNVMKGDHSRLSDNAVAFVTAAWRRKSHIRHGAQVVG